MDGFALAKIAATDVETFVQMCVVPPAIHRYGGSMARRVHALAQHIIENYDGRTEGIWLDGRPKPDGPEALKRLRALRSSMLVNSSFSLRRSLAPVTCFSNRSNTFALASAAIGRSPSQIFAAAFITAVVSAIAEASRLTALNLAEPPGR
jgi:hypothetical protein